jgi:cytochrome c oxidase accessory protein FixG
MESVLPPDPESPRTDLNTEGEGGTAEHNEVIHVLNLYQTAEKIYTRRLKGFYRSLRRWAWVPMLAGYFLIPWLSIDGRQAVWFDLTERKFYILWITFWPQDLPFLAALLIIAAFALFTVTNLLGRVWCGFACPQTVWTGIFIAIEDWFEGDRNKRIKLDAQPWNANKLVRKGAVQLCWILFSFVTGLTFVGYFNPIRELVPDLFNLSINTATLFWALLFTVLTWANAGFMREQICLYVCPYARFQSVMFDSDTLVVSYNQNRGEPRGARKRDAGINDAEKNTAVSELGDCVDCTLCVQVCPTGIDIRDGLQYECISCGLCIDACNAVMKKMHYPPGLINFTTENTLQGGAGFRWLRPRLLGYFTVLALLCGLFLYQLSARIPLEVDIIRDRSTLFRITPQGLIENSYLLKINNMDQRDHHYTITVQRAGEAANENSINSSTAFIYKGQSTVEVAEGEVVERLVRLQLPRKMVTKTNTAVEFIVKSTTSPGLQNAETSRFLAPAKTVKRK